MTRTSVTCPEQRVEIYDTTLRDGSQLEGISLTVEDKLRIAEQLDWLGVALHRGRLARREPEGRRAVPARAVGAAARRRARSSRSARPGGSRARSTATTRCAISSRRTSARCASSASRGTTTSLEALGTTLDEGVAMVARLGRVPARRGPRRALRRRALLRRLQAQSRVRAARARGRGDQGRVARSCCATPTVARCRTRSNGSSREVVDVLRWRRRRRGAPPRRRRHRRRERDRRRARRRDAGAGHDQRLRRAHRQLQPHDDHPEPHAEDGDRDDPAPTASSGSRRSRTTSPSSSTCRSTRRRAYVGHSAFAHKAGLHTSAIAKRPDAYEHVSPDSVGNGTRFVVSELAGKSTLVLKAKELGLELDGPQLAEVVEKLKRLEHEGYHFEVADGSLELLMRRATGWEPDWFEVESFRVITDDRVGRRHAHRRDRRDGDDRGDGEGATSAASGVIATAEGNGPVNALDRALRNALNGTLPGARARAPHRLQGARPRHEQGHRRGHAGADRLDRRRRRRGRRSA